VGSTLRQALCGSRRWAAVALAGAFIALALASPVLAGEGAPAPPDAATPARLDLTEHVPHWAQHRILGVAVWQFTTAFLFVLAGLTLKRMSDYAFRNKIIPLLERTRYAFDHLLAGAASAPVGYGLLLLALDGAFSVLPLPRQPDVRAFAFGALKVLAAADILWFLFRIVDVGDRYLTGLAQRTESKLDDQLVPVIRKSLKVTIGIIGSVWVIQLLGYSVSSLVAGLGIGGLAIALALQDTLANFFGSVFIFLDRPFAVGDWIKMDGVDGVVEDIGFRSTRVRTWPATLVSIPNKTVAAATIDNWSRMPKRRVLQTVGVTYETTADQMEQAVEGIRKIIESEKGVDSEFIVVRFDGFGDSSLNIMVYYYTKATRLADHMATKERINLAIMRLLDQMGLSIAFPTRTLYLEGAVAERVAEGLGTPRG